MLGRDVLRPARSTASILVAAAIPHCGTVRRARSVPAATPSSLSVWNVGAGSNLKTGEPRWPQSKIFRDNHQRWAEFDGGKRGAGQGKEGCLSVRKTIVCTGIDATYVGLDSHAWHAVSRGRIETFLSGFVLPDCLY